MFGHSSPYGAYGMFDSDSEESSEYMPEDTDLSHYKVSSESASYLIAISNALDRPETQCEGVVVAR